MSHKSSFCFRATLFLPGSRLPSRSLTLTWSSLNMASSASPVKVWFLFFAGVTAVMASAEYPSASPTASPNATVSVKDRAVGWLKITAVPLSVVLIGSCLWGFFKNTALGRSCLGRGGEAGAPARPDEAAVRPAV